MDEKVKKYLKIGGIVAGVGIAGFVAYKMMKKNQSSVSGLNGIGGRRRKKKSSRKKIKPLLLR